MLLPFPERRHARASITSARAALASISAKTSRVIPLKSRALAKDTISRHQWEGMPRGRQELTVDALSANAPATSPVPPKASMISPAVENMPGNIVRKLRTRQVFATRETISGVDCAGIDPMPDTLREQARRLELTRIALGFENQAEFCRQIGVGKNIYNPMEKGRRWLTINVAKRIKARFGIGLDWTVCGDPAQLPPQIYRKIGKVA